MPRTSIYDSIPSHPTARMTLFTENFTTQVKIFTFRTALMNQGQCVFSGQMIPKGSGIHRVCNDNKVVFVWGRRELRYISKKISPRSIKWTESSRTFFHKTHASVAEKKDFVPITKIVRGFPLIPKALVNEKSIKQTTEKTTPGQHPSKVHKNANINVTRK